MAADAGDWHAPTVDTAMARVFESGTSWTRSTATVLIATGMEGRRPGRVDEPNRSRSAIGSRRFVREEWQTTARLRQANADRTRVTDTVVCALMDPRGPRAFIPIRRRHYGSDAEECGRGLPDSAGP